MSLQQLLDEGIIDEVYQQLKTGKEAEVWLVSHRGEAVAAKIYKERDRRNFKNDAGYLEGRTVRNSRTQRAMDKGTAFGRKAAEEAWKSAEADALYALAAAGVRVPKPVLFYEGILLMEVIGDAEGRVAPRLVEAAIAREEAAGLYERLRGEVVKMLAADLIHGDLSEFNILLGVDGPVIIDFPQVVAAARNSRSEQFFRRDVGNLLRFFSGIDPALQRHANDANEIWWAYTRRELHREWVPSGKFVQDQRGTDRGGPPSRKQQRRDERRDERPQKGPQVSFKGQTPPAVGRPENQRSDQPRSDQRTDHPRGGPRNEHRQEEHPRNEHPRNEHPRNEHPRNEHPRNEHPRNEHPRNEHPRNEHPRNEHPRNEHPRSEHPRNEHPRGEPPRNEHPRNQQRTDGRSQQPRNPQQQRTDGPRNPQRGNQQRSDGPRAPQNEQRREGGRDGRRRRRRYW